MQPYQNFSMSQPMMNPYQQNFNSQMNMPNPYIERMNQLQNYQQSLQQPVQQIPQAQGLVGKIVNDVSVVSPNDVPMDGNVAIFPKNDMSEIYCKQWKQDGTIQTVVYKPILEQNSQEGTNIPQMDFNALNEDVRALREDIKDMRGLIEKSMGGTASKTSARGKKAEANENE